MIKTTKENVQYQLHFLGPPPKKKVEWGQKLSYQNTYHTSTRRTNDFSNLFLRFICFIWVIQANGFCYAKYVYFTI